MKKPSYRYRFLITIILAAVLILDSGLICAEADSEAGLEEYIAMGIVAGEGSASPYDTSENETEPILEVLFYLLLLVSFSFLLSHHLGLSKFLFVYRFRIL